MISTEPYGGEYDLDNTNRQSYNFGKGYDEKHFIRKGYTGSVDVTLIYLKTEGEETNYKALQDVIFKIDEQIGLGLYTDIAPEAKKDGSRKTVDVYSYDIDEYRRKVVVDLFKKHPLTEYDRNEDQEGFSDVFSLDQVTRAETPGFHYLNIFGKSVLETGSSFSSSDFYRFEENPKEYLNEESGLIFRLQE